jgi:alcohol dehydrogenase class IV
MTQRLFFGVGAIARLERVLDRLRARRVFLVTGRASFLASGAAAAVEPILGGRDVYRHDEFSQNPKLDDLTPAIAAFRSRVFDVVVAIGGGSVIDTAKLVNVFAHHEPGPAELIEAGSPIARGGLPVIAVPTTSGSGSEATHFGVVYRGHVKHSIASPYLLPEVAIVDPALTFSLSPRLTAITAMDAFTQAVESYWCVHSTEESKGYARRAIALVLEHVRDGVACPTLRTRRGLSKAAHLAGRAINITKTTAAHALSYPLTSYFGIPHGHAVCLTLGQFLLFNSDVTERDVTDRRGAQYVRQIVKDLVHMMGCSDPRQGCQAIDALIKGVGLQTRLGALGISRDDAVNVVVNNVNAERLVNNPRALNHDSLTTLVHAIC